MQQDVLLFCMATHSIDIQEEGLYAIFKVTLTSKYCYGTRQFTLALWKTVFLRQVLMAKNVIIVESPAKIKTIKKFLGTEYTILASVGHIRDLPANRLGVDEKHDFAPEYGIIPGKEEVVEKLQKAAKNAVVYLAPDPDREGEAIAWHIAELIKDDAKEIHRIQFNEITKRAILAALENPRDINDDLVNAQQARRILDRLVGYKISPLLWQKVKRGISAGRVQSVALRLIVERGVERKNFVPEEYWVLKALLNTQDGEPLQVELDKIEGKAAKVHTEEEAQHLCSIANSSTWTVQQIKQTKKQKKPQPPFITSTLQQVANTRCNYSSKRTMSIAQKLYEGIDIGERGVTALITYMRTDSVRISEEAQYEAESYIRSAFGEAFVPKKRHTFKQKSSMQDAHEAIRPVDVTIHPEDIKAHVTQEQYTLYKLIWQRFVASQMAAAEVNQTTVIVKTESLQWKAVGEQLIFQGFMALTGVEDTAQLLPAMQEGDVLKLQEILSQQKFTQPPALYTDASLVRALEERGIGRPSTYASIIATLQEREYVTVQNKHFIPTDLGTVVADLLTENFTTLMNVAFTSDMEDSLDSVAKGTKEWIPLLHSFYDDFQKTLTHAAEHMEDRRAFDSGIVCEKCSNPMLVRFGKNGAFLACSNYPECSNTKNFIRNEAGEIQLEERPQEKIVVPVGQCPECGNALVEKRSRMATRFIACSNYPECKYTKSYSLGVPCPQEGCSGEIVEKSSKKGKIFYACSAYPECTYALWDKPVQRACPACSFPIMTEKVVRGNKVCLCPSCKYKETGEDSSEASGSTPI